MTDKIDIYTMLQKGFAAKKESRVSEGGDWRGGNSGCITADGDILGASPKVTVLRHLGIEPETTLDDDLIFEAGFKNEEHWTELLDFAKIPYKTERDIPVKWALPNGQTVTGSPDIVLFDGSDKPDLGIELKLVSSNGKMQKHSHFGAANPSASHVCQSAHYSSKLGIDWVLAYTSRSYYTAFYWGADKFPLEHRSMLMDEVKNKVISVGPFISMYDITWDGDTLLLDGKPTVITASGVERYYQYCSDCIRDKVIPKNGGERDIWGKKDPKNPNKLYDDYKDAADHDFDQWVEDCRLIAAGGS